MRTFATPLIYIFFNRPEVTRKTFAAVRALRPQRLYLIADGPRLGHPSDARRCAETRDVVEGMLDWDCEITRDFSPVNLGCGLRVSSGLTAAFVLLGEAIVLEDDVSVHPDFFPFCATMLAKYRDNPRIHSISGFNPLGRYAPKQGTVVPSQFSWIWGWASWQRAWKDYHFDISELWVQPELKTRIRQSIGNSLNFGWHSHNFDSLLAGHVNTWDFQWAFALLNEGRLTLTSSVNLVENLGFNSEATHTGTELAYLKSLQTYPLVKTSAERSLLAHDRLHDKLFGQVIHNCGGLKTWLYRTWARYPDLGKSVGCL